MIVVIVVVACLVGAAAFAVGQWSGRRDVTGELQRHVRDMITGLLTYRAWWEHAAQRVHGQTFAYLDIDGYRDLNDEHGTSVGDQVLKGFADAVRFALPDVYGIGRLAADTVAVVTDKAPDEVRKAIHSVQDVRVPVTTEVRANGVSTLLRGTALVKAIGVVTVGDVGESVKDVVDRMTGQVQRGKEEVPRASIVSWDAPVQRPPMSTRVVYPSDPRPEQYRNDADKTMELGGRHRR